MKKLVCFILLILCIVGVCLIFLNINGKKNNENNIEIGYEENINQEEVETKADVIVLSEKMFLLNLDDIYMNHEEYEGKYLQLDGFIFNIPETGNPLVAREYNCCGADNFLIGIECEETNSTYPNDTWVRATGKIKVVKDENNKLNPIVINLIDVTMEEIPEGNRLVSY